MQQILFCNLLIIKDSQNKVYATILSINYFLILMCNNFNIKNLKTY
jgi:hypothetical protein